MKKEHAFAYMIQLFISWYQEKKGIATIEECYPHFSKLSLLKLLFLTVAVKTDADNPKSDLLDTFGRFSAMPYGPVELDIYDAISLDSIPMFTIGDRAIYPNSNNSLELSDPEKESIKKSVDSLRAKNPQLITLDAFKLVHITHFWKSWSDAYGFAQFVGQKAKDMEPDVIRNEKYPYFGN